MTRWQYESVRVEFTSRFEANENSGNHGSIRQMTKVLDDVNRRHRQPRTLRPIVNFYAGRHVLFNTRIDSKHI